MDKIIQTNPELIVLIKIIIAHIISDFVFQTKKMVETKNWLSIAMIGHTFTVFATTLLFSFSIWQSLIITVTHYFIDGFKISLSKSQNFKEKKLLLFVYDQIAHILSIVLIWAIYNNHLNQLFHDIEWLFNQSQFLIVISAYIIITFPLGFLIGLATSKINESEENQETDYNGLKIGIYERIIILTFVLLEQYEAIGFLIAGKSLLRFASRNQHKKSEYVLLGTMMSYALTIIIGVIMKQIM